MKLFLFIVLLIPLNAAADEQSWTPDLTVIGKLEADIKLGSLPGRDSKRERLVSDYDRYYAGWTTDGQRMIEGVFILQHNGQPGSVRIVASRKSLPRTFDGGCSILHVTYDVKADRIASLKCNGYL